MSEHFDSGGLALPGGGRGMGVPGAPWKREIVIEEHLLRKVSYPWGRTREAGPRPLTWGTDSVTQGVTGLLVRSYHVGGEALGS